MTHAYLRRAEQAVQLAPVAPPCFTAHDQWLEYIRTAAIEQRAGRLPGPLLIQPGKPTVFNPRFVFCADCTAQHSLRMHRAGKCQPKYLIALLAPVAEKATA